MLINFSNHPSGKWQQEQLQVAAQFGEIVDLPFPDVNPEGDENYIQSLCNEYVSKVEQLAENKQIVVHVMGEMTFSFAMVNALQKLNIICVASTTERIAKEENGVKTSDFRFKQFRKYAH